MYEATDKYLIRLKRKIRTEFNRFSVLGFDELNVMNTRKIVGTVYKTLMDFNESEYQRIAQSGYEEGKQAFLDSGLDKVIRRKAREDILDTLVIVKEVFREYNPVTGYLYLSEADRKRARQVEIMLSDREKQDRTTFEKDIRHAADLWYTQSSQYGQDVEDRAYTQALIDCGVHHVQWVIEHDGKVCEHCKSMDGNIYPVKKIPPKQHYRCRCYWIPID